MTLSDLERQNARGPVFFRLCLFCLLVCLTTLLLLTAEFDRNWTNGTSVRSYRLSNCDQIRHGNTLRKRRVFSSQPRPHYKEAGPQRYPR